MVRDEKVKPLDKLMDEKTNEFESGVEKERDKDLDNMIWELGDYENQESPQDAAEFKADPPIEEELGEKELRAAGKGQAHLREPDYVEDALPGGEKLVEAMTVGPAGEEEEGESAPAEPYPKKKRLHRHRTFCVRKS